MRDRLLSIRSLPSVSMGRTLDYSFPYIRKESDTIMKTLSSFHLIRYVVLYEYSI